MIDHKEVEYIAKLAKLSLTAQEKDTFVKQLSSVLDYMKQLDEVDTSDIEPTCFLAPEHEPYRDDVERESLPVKSVFQNAPHLKKQFFAIPKIIG